MSTKARMKKSKATTAALDPITIDPAELSIRFNPREIEKQFLSNMKKEIILARIEKLKKNPVEMLTLNMGGKMSGGNSISTSCRYADSNCQRRIAKSIEDVRKFSPEAENIINRYLLDSRDKRHISGTKAAKLLIKLGVKVCVCIFCYADSKQAWQHGAREKFIVNFEYYGKTRRESNEMPTAVPFEVDGKGYFRIEAEGDTQNVDQAYSYISMVEKETNQGTSFSVWTKNIGYWIRALKLKGYLVPGNIKPKNLTIVLSSAFINHPDYSVFNYYNRLYPGLIGRLFTVCTPDWAIENDIVFNCCDGKKEKHCLECMNCYRDNGFTYIWEILR